MHSFAIRMKITNSIIYRVSNDVDETAVPTDLTNGQSSSSSPQPPALPEENGSDSNKQQQQQEAYCTLCERSFCNKYFLKTHFAKKHGVLNLASPSSDSTKNQSSPSSPAAPTTTTTTTTTDQPVPSIVSEDYCEVSVMKKFSLFQIHFF